MTTCEKLQEIKAFLNARICKLDTLIIEDSPPSGNAEMFAYHCGALSEARAINEMICKGVVK